MAVPKLRTPWLIGALLVGSLLLLVTLQYRWLGQVSNAQRERLEADLQRDAVRFANDLDSELSLLVALFQPVAIPFGGGGGPGGGPRGRLERDGAARLAATVERFRQESQWPDLLTEVILVLPEPEGVVYQDLEGNDLTADEVPEAEGLLGQQWRRRPGPSLHPVLLDNVPAIGLPAYLRLDQLRRSGPPGRGEAGRGGLDRGGNNRDRGGNNRDSERGRRQRHDSWPPRMDWAILRLNQDLLFDEMLPELARRHFSPSGSPSGSPRTSSNGGESQLAYQVAVIDQDDKPVFTAGPAAKNSSRSDLEVPLFGLVQHDEMLALVEGLQESVGESTRERSREDEGRRSRMTLTALTSELVEHRWRLRVTHPAGSLEAALGAAHRRNLLTSAGIFAVLVTALVLLLMSVRRSQQLARQQLEFVSGVTHELLTPLAAMRSAGQNLADGVITDPERTQRYGQLIVREGRRLSDMVRQMLDYAGIQSGQRSYSPEPVEVARAIHSVVERHRIFLDEKRFSVDIDLPDDLPRAMADREALSWALSNLVGNAVKYAASGRWLGLSAKSRSGGVEIRVADRGPGIAKSDLPHLFKPFYRGRRLAATNVPGSGLGLALVHHIAEALDGSIKAQSNDNGAVFILWLPRAPDVQKELVEAYES